MKPVLGKLPILGILPFIVYVNAFALSTFPYTIGILKSSSFCFDNLLLILPNSSTVLLGIILSSIFNCVSSSACIFIVFSSCSNLLTTPLNKIDECNMFNDLSSCTSALIFKSIELAEFV